MKHCKHSNKYLEQDNIPLINGSIIPLRPMHKRLKSGYADVELGEDSSDGQDAFWSVTYYRVFCNAQTVFKHLKEGREKPKKVVPVRPNLQSVTGSLSPFASNMMGGSK